MKTAAPNTTTKSAPAKRRAGAKNRSEPMPQSARRIAEPDPAPPASEATPPAPEPAARSSHPAPRAPAKSGGLDGFRVEADTAHQRLATIPRRPPPAPLSRLAWNSAAPARCRKPVIAASRGYCFGVGFELALACDFRLVTESTVYALPEQRLGMIPGSGGAARLQRMVGVTRAKDIVMRSRRITGFRAFEWGIATECVADAELEKISDALVEELCSFAPLAQRSAKKLLNDCEDASLSLAIELEGQAYGRLRSSDDFIEGVEAFHAKRQPNFKGS